MPELLRFTVPVVPRTCSNAPCQASSPARVTTNEGMRKRVKSEPWSRPIAAPARMPAAIAGAGPQPCLTFSTAITAAHTPLTAPIERSISPSSSTSTTPTEIRPTAVIWRKRLVRLTAERKRSFWDWKTIQITAIARITRSEARSPWTKRRTTSAALALSAGDSAGDAESRTVSLIVPPPRWAWIRTRPR